jgi:hypothetical protein
MCVKIESENKPDLHDFWPTDQSETNALRNFQFWAVFVSKQDKNTQNTFDFDQIFLVLFSIWLEINLIMDAKILSASANPTLR